MKGQKRNFLEIFSLKFRYRLKNDFLVSSLQIVLNHSCVKYVSYELHQMKGEDLSFNNIGRHVK